MKSLVCFGDSITARHEGYDSPRLTALLEDTLDDDWCVINSGVSGDNTRDAVARIEADVLHYHPDYVTVLFGANDAAFHKMISLTEYEQHLRTIVSKVSPKNCILISPAPVDERVQFARTNILLQQYAKVVEKISINTGCYYIDLFTAMWSEPNYPELLKSDRDDGLHFGPLGYKFLSSMIIEKLKIIEGEEDRVNNKPLLARIKSLKFLSRCKRQ